MQSTLNLEVTKSAFCIHFCHSEFIYVQPFSRFHNVSTILRNYLEHYNGEGYPDGLIGKKIPLGARILVVADAYGSMIDKRPYKQALTHQEAIAELQRYSNDQFDPVVVDAFIRRKGNGGKKR